MVQPREVIKLVDIFSRRDPTDVRAAFQIAVNLAPHGIVPGNANFREEVYALVTTALRQNAISQYVDELKRRIPMAAQEVDAVLTFPNPTSGPSPVEEILLQGHIPFFDRRSLRARLQELLDPKNTRRVVVVEGESISGKSHSAQLISFVGAASAGARIVWAELTKLHPEFQFEPFDLMEWISEQLDLTLDPKYRVSREQDPRTTLRLVNWFAGQFEKINPPQPVWLIVDDLNSPACPPWVVEFVIGLADRMAKQQFRDLTLFLIGFREQRLPSVARFLTLADEAVAPTRDDLWDFIVTAAGRRGRLLEPEKKAAVVGRIWQDVTRKLRHEDYDEIAAKAGRFVQSL